MEETCFIIMPIGTQEYESVQYKEDELRKKYDDLIKQAIFSAREGIKVFRADDVSMPGSITNDILTRIMFSKYVIADISLPNPNVFYELGIRHAIKTGTILIKDKNVKSTVFDISHLRHIEYENTATGLKELSVKLKQSFQWMDRNPQKPDNQFIELAGFMKYQYPKFIDLEAEKRNKLNAIISLMGPFFKNPEIMKTLLDNSIPQEEKNLRLIDMFKDDPDLMTELFKNLATGGFLDNKLP